jgi:hypothetical protein
MKLHEIIAANDNGKELLIELLYTYKKSLLTYYTDYFCCEPVLFVTMVCNAVQYAKIISSNEFSEVLEDYCADMEADEIEGEMETINYNSIFLTNL